MSITRINQQVEFREIISFYSKVIRNTHMLCQTITEFDRLIRVGHMVDNELQYGTSKHLC